VMHAVAQIVPPFLLSIRSVNARAEEARCP
jgi:hypothetical protein